MLFPKHNMPLLDRVPYLAVLSSLNITHYLHTPLLKVDGLFIFQGSVQMSPALHSRNMVLVSPVQEWIMLLLMVISCELEKCQSTMVTSIDSEPEGLPVSQLISCTRLNSVLSKSTSF